jgi:hypothetical protein
LPELEESKLELDPLKAQIRLRISKSDNLLIKRTNSNLEAVVRDSHSVDVGRVKVTS